MAFRLWIASGRAPGPMLRATDQITQRRRSMAADIRTDREPPLIDYHAAAGLEPPETPPPPEPPAPPEMPHPDGKAWREWMMVATGLVGLGVILAIIFSVFAFAENGSGET